jgi:hypothetical protein
VFPVLFNIVLIAIITADKNHLDVIYVFPTNMYATIIGVVFATGALCKSSVRACAKD